MTTVCDMINRGTTDDGKDPSAPLKDFIRSSEVGPDHPAYAAAADFLSDGGVTTAGKNVLSTLKKALSVFNNEGIRCVTAASDVSIRDMVREKTVVYMHLMEEGAPYMVLMTAFMNQWWRIAQAEADMNGSRLPHETAILGDEWEWANRASVKDGAIVIKGAENSKPGHEGVFQMPVIYASNTPAGEFFGLGSEQECDIKRMQFRHNAKSQAAACNHDVEVWRVNFDACKSEQTAQAEVVDDEWQAWDGM